ncbi:N-acetylmuramoyl-L-alanine amidase [Cellulosimicrobium protaetiae]
MAGESFFGLDHPNRRSPQVGNPRRGGGKPSGTIVIHTAECAADLVGADTSAEGVARYLTERTTPGSYHRIVDSDSIVKFAPLGYETWHCRFTNNWSIGISFAVQAHLWATYPPAFVTKILRQGARTTAEAIRDLKKVWGITVPLKRINRKQALAKAPGFIGHGETDPTRRSDPGPAFPWARFLDMVRAELDNPTEEDDDMPTADEIAKAMWNRPIKNRAGKTVTVGKLLQDLHDDVADEVWTRPVTGLDGKKYTIGATVNGIARNAHAAATDAAIARRLAEEAAKGRHLSDEEIARLADEVAARVELITAADVAAQLVITTTPKETP